MDLSSDDGETFLSKKSIAYRRGYNKHPVVAKNSKQQNYHRSIKNQPRRNNRFFQEKNKLKNYKRGIYKNNKQRFKNRRKVIGYTVWPKRKNGYTVYGWPKRKKRNYQPSKKMYNIKRKPSVKSRKVNSNKIRDVKYNSYNRMMFLLNKIKSYYGSGKPSFEQAVNIVGIKNAKQLVAKNLIYQKNPIFQNPRSLGFREKNVYYEDAPGVNNYGETLDDFYSYSLHPVF